MVPFYGIHSRALSLAVALGLFLGPVKAQEPVPRGVTYPVTSEDFANPERGFHKFRSLLSPADFDIRGEAKTLIYGEIAAPDFRDKPFTPEFLVRIQAGFDAVRKHGIKVNPRVVYSVDIGQPDAPLAVVLGHIAQLKPLWEKNKDVINALDPGFVGAWGEWHSSSNNLDRKENRKKILDALLAALPSDRMLLVRQPRFKREYLTGDPASTSAMLTEAKAFSGAPIARIGHLNDCFLSSPDDQGTYAGGSLPQELGYLESESRFAPWGGETCGLHARNDCANALVEMAKVHADYLNSDYQGDVLAKWRTQGCYDEIARRLGYRFVLQSAKIASNVKPGGILALEVTFRNEGFGELFNPRDVEMVIYAPGGREVVAPLKLDPRRWSGGQTVVLKVKLGFPLNFSEGTYTLGIRLPDKSETLRKDFRYAIRFANDGVWNPANGVNELIRDLRVEKIALGSVDPAIARFEVRPDSPTGVETLDIDPTALSLRDAGSRFEGAGGRPHWEFRFGPGPSSPPTDAQGRRLAPAYFGPMEAARTPGAPPRGARPKGAGEK